MTTPTLAELFDAADLKLPLRVVADEDENTIDAVDLDGEDVFRCDEPGLTAPIVAAVNHIDPLVAALRDFITESPRCELARNDTYCLTHNERTPCSLGKVMADGQAALAAFDAAVAEARGGGT